MSGTANPRFSVQNLYDVHSVASATALLDIMTTAITPNRACLLRVKVSLATASVFNWTETRSAVTKTIPFNSGAALVAGAGYAFEMPVTPLTTYNFQYTTASIINCLQVDEVYEGTP